MQFKWMVATLGALGTLSGGWAEAASSRVEGLVGDPAEARNGMFVKDDLNIFLNPALAARWRGRIPLSLGITQDQGDLVLDPFGGALIPIGDTFTLGVFLNRRPGLFADQAALNTVLEGLIQGGSYVGPDGSSTGVTAQKLFLPVDIIAAFATDAVEIGASVYAAFGKDGSMSENYDEDGDVTTRSTRDSAANYITAGFGARILADGVTPEFWLRYGGAASWSDGYDENFSLDGDPRTSDGTYGVQGVNSFAIGVRVPFSAGDFLITPGVNVGFAGGQPLYDDRTSDSPLEDLFYRHDAVAATFGVGVEYSPDEDFRLVATVSGEVDVLTTTREGGEDESYFFNVNRATDVRLPIASFGAEASITKHLMVRGAIRAGLATSVKGGVNLSDNQDGPTNSTYTSESGGAGNSFSAAGGLSIPFEKVVVDISAGGMLVAQEEGGSFFSRADLTFILPD